MACARESESVQDPTPVILAAELVSDTRLVSLPNSPQSYGLQLEQEDLREG